MVEDTESPRIFHIWSAIAAISMAMGRRCYLPFGTFNIYPNQMILLIGTPGTRKSTASSMAKKIVSDSTGVKFAPGDTAGHRQGMVLAMRGTQSDQPAEFVNGQELASKRDSISSLTELEEVTNEISDEEVKEIDSADKHVLNFVASEFSRVIGQNNTQMLDFLGERYDGEDYEYQTKTEHIKLTGTLVNLLACTTPTSISIALPPQAGGQGFLSRIILVYGARKYKLVPRPRAPDVELVGRVKEVIATVFDQFSGAFTESDDGRLYCESLYGYNIEIADSRFAYYAERRYTHLIKVAMCLAAASGRQEIIREDYEEAHRILRATERGMPDALGEFGMNPLAMLKQEILEQLRASQGPLTMEQIVSMFHRDARGSEITEVLNDLVKMGQLKVNTLASGNRVLSAVYTKQNTEDQMMSLLAEK